MNLPQKIENKIKEEAIKFLEKGKPDWDIPHTLTAVYWMKELIKKEGGNEKILIPAMYIHDTGYPILKKGYNYEDLMISKKSHAERGGENAKNILSKFKIFTNSEIEEIVYLIKNHDIHNNLETKNRQLVFEADTLAQIDWEKVPPNFDKENFTIWLDKYFFGKRKAPERIKTETGKKFLKKLMAGVDKYLK
ncbi:MAG: hypothetical protein V1655_00985 [bacterium]